MTKISRRQTAVAHRKGNEDIATGILSAPSNTCKTNTGPLRKPGALMRQQRRIGSNGNHDGTHARLADIDLAPERRRHIIQYLADRIPRHPQRFSYAVVGLHQSANGPAALLSAQHPRSGADATLEFMANHARATTHIALLDRAGPCILQRQLHMLGAHVLAPDVIQGAIVGFQYHRHAPIGVLLAHFTFCGHQRIAHYTDTVGVGIGDGRGQ